MSAAIHQMIVRKRAAQAQANASVERLAQLTAEAKGEAGQPPAHEWDGTKLRFQNPDGTWGEWVDLRGAAGKKGDKGDQGNSGRVVVAGGRAAFHPDALPSLPSSLFPTDTVVVARNGVAYRALAAEILGGDMPVFARRTDFVSETLFYRGEAAPGTDETAAGWRIARIAIAPDGDVTEEWAGGTAAFDKIWAARTDLEYQ